MKFYHVAPEKQVSNIFNSGIYPDAKGEIKIIVLKDNFLMTKYVLDMYAFEELGVDIYCAFEVSGEGIPGALTASTIKSIFSDSYKVTKQECIERNYLKPFTSGESYEGMGLINGVFPVENKDKFTPEYKQKVLEYLSEVPA